MEQIPEQHQPFQPVIDPRPSDVSWPTMVWPIPQATELVGTHVKLVKLDPASDAPALFSALNHDLVWQHLADRPNSPEHLSKILLARHARSDWQQWKVVANHAREGSSKEDIIGMTSYFEVSTNDARLEIGATAYTPSMWGTLVNPETKMLLLGYAFEVLRVGRVQIKTDVRNVRSQRAIASLGAQYEGLLRRYQRRSDNTVRDTVLFSIIAEDWPEVQKRLQRRLAKSIE